VAKGVDCGARTAAEDRPAVAHDDNSVLSVLGTLLEEYTRSKEALW